MNCLVNIIRFVNETATWLVGLAFARAFLVRMPPRNYGQGQTSSDVTAETASESLDESRSDTTLVNRFFDDSPGGVCVQGEPEEIDDFFVCKKCRSSEQFNMAILRAASDRVSDILLEHRQRLDNGQDPCAKRREARRRRTQELVHLVTAF